GLTYALPVPAPVPPPASGAWKLNHLIYMAGLPVPSDLDLVGLTFETLRQTDADSINFSLLEKKWDIVMKPTPARHVANDVKKSWLRLAARIFIDEVNNFPAIAVGSPPFADAKDGEEGLLGFHDLRGSGMGDLGVSVFERVAGTGRGGRPPIMLGSGTSSNN